MPNQADKSAEIRKLLEVVRKSGIGSYVDMQRLVTRYAIERFLYRLGRSNYEQSFVLKGAMLLPIYVQSELRSTRDADFLVYGQFDSATIKSALADICNIKCDDGMTFSPSGITVEAAGNDREYPGHAVKVPARLGDFNCDVSLDIGFGEAVTPPAKLIKYPSMLSLPKPEIRVYPLETAIAEKFQAIVYLGMSNARLKDYYDLSLIARTCELDGGALREAINATFNRRGTSIPASIPTGLSSDFYLSRTKQVDWKAFLKRLSLKKGASLEVVCQTIEGMLMPVVKAIASSEKFDQSWTGGNWQPKPDASPQRSSV